MTEQRDRSESGNKVATPVIEAPAERKPGLSFKPSAIWETVRGYLGLDRATRRDPVVDKESLDYFVHTRASYIAQTSLYGYLRTRAGMRYPELFDDDPFVVSINIAKWQVWLSCVSDLAVYSGGLIVRAAPDARNRVAGLMVEVVNGILERTGVPPDAGEAFEEEAVKVRERVASCNWAAVMDGDSAFSESPVSVVRWAPIMDKLKELDEEVVLNSVRFRWQEVRRDLRRDMDVQAVLDSLS